MEQQPLISFIIPVYGAEKVLDRCVQSVLAQETDDWELILVDDESPDSSGEMCEEYAGKDDRIRVIHKKNGGQGAARNTGAAQATGKWLMFIDDDDWLDKNMYSECAPFLTEDVDILVFSRRDVYNTTSKDRKIGIPSRVLSFKTEEEKQALQINMLNFFAPYKYPLNRVLFTTPWGKFYRRTFWQENQLAFIEGYGEDRPCLLKAYGCARKITYLDNCYYNYWIHESTMRKYLENACDKYEMSLKSVHNYVHKYLNDSAACRKALRHTDIAYFSMFVIQDYCHRLNPHPYHYRKERFQQDLSKNNFLKAFHKSDLACLPLRRRVLAMLIRTGNFFLVNLMCRANDIWNYFAFNRH